MSTEHTFQTSDGCNWDLETHGGDSPHVSACLSSDYEDSHEIDLTIDDLANLTKAIHDRQRAVDASRKLDEDRHTSKLAYLLSVARGTDANHTAMMRQRCVTLGVKIDD